MLFIHVWNFSAKRVFGVPTNPHPDGTCQILRIGFHPKMPMMTNIMFSRKSMLVTNPPLISITLTAKQKKFGIRQQTKWNFSSRVVLFSISTSKVGMRGERVCFKIIFAQFYAFVNKKHRSEASVFYSCYFTKMSNVFSFVEFVLSVRIPFSL